MKMGIKSAIFSNFNSWREELSGRKKFVVMNSPDSKDENGKIIVADDDPINQQLISYQLNGLKKRLIFARDGFEALRLFQETSDVRLVLMDVRMPGMSGVEATQKILELDPQAKIIALSAFAEEENEFETSEVGFVDYVSKPIRRDDLLQVIAKYL